MSFTDEKPRVATEKDVSGPWRGVKGGEYFRCYFCGHRFRVGEIWRWAWGIEGCCNFLVCEGCDGEDVQERWKKLNEEWKRLRDTKFWWFVKTSEV